MALQKLGLKVGVLDADIYGPSIPTMLGNAGKTPMIEAEQFVPLDAFGMPVLSIGHLTGDHNTPVAWRGPKATGALMQLFNQTLWPDLDVLMIDMPPGTGDIQLTLAQRIYSLQQTRELLNERDSSNYICFLFFKADIYSLSSSLLCNHIGVYITAITYQLHTIYLRFFVTP